MGSIVNTIRPWQPNLLINGGFDYWQRGTSASFSGATTVYRGVDRWVQRPGGSTPSGTISRDTDVPNTTFTFSLKSVGTGGASGIGFYQRIEADVIRPYVGQTMTFSIWLKQSVASSGYALRAAIPASGVKDSWNADIAADTQFATITPSFGTNIWTQVSLTFTVPAGATFGMAVGFDGAASNATTSWAAGAMLTLGANIPSQFYRLGATLQQELAACQRYYQKSFRPNVTPVQNSTDTSGSVGFIAQNTAGSSFDVYVPLPVQMRIPPTVVTYSPNAASANWLTNGTTPVASLVQSTELAIQIRASSATSIGNAYSIHYTADAEL